MRYLPLLWVLILAFLSGMGLSHAQNPKAKDFDGAINRLKQMGDSAPATVSIPKLPADAMLFVVIKTNSKWACPTGMLRSEFDDGIENPKIPTLTCMGSHPGGVDLSLPTIGTMHVRVVAQNGGSVFDFEWPRRAPPAELPPKVEIPAFGTNRFLIIRIEGSTINVCPMGFMLSGLVDKRGKAQDGYFCSGASVGGFTLTVPDYSTGVRVEADPFLFEWHAKKK